MRKLLTSLIVGASIAVVAGTASAQGVNVQVEMDRPSHRMERHMSPDVDRATRLERRRGWDRDIDATSGVRVERRYDMVHPVASRRIVERRYVMPRRARTVCRTVVRERMRPNGVVVRRPVEICRRVVAGGRRFID
jgi:hypothetical protein